MGLPGEAIVGLIAPVPMVALVLFWWKRPRKRDRAFAEATGAIAAAVVIMMAGGALLDSADSGVWFGSPAVLICIVMALALNRMSRAADRGGESESPGTAT